MIESIVEESNEKGHGTEIKYRGVSNDGIIKE